MLETFFILIGLHCIADYPLQGEFLSSMKGKNATLMVAHCFIWTSLIYAGLVYLNLDSTWQLPFLFFGHYIIDKWKCSRSGNGKELGSDLLIDQALHGVQILVCVFL